MAVSDGTMLKKHHVGLWINGGTYEDPKWVRIKKSTENTITMNAETREVDYIVDENPTTILDKYKPSLSQPIVMYKGEPDFEFVFDKFFKQSVGADAEGEVLIVFYGADGGAQDERRHGEANVYLQSTVLIQLTLLSQWALTLQARPRR